MIIRCVAFNRSHDGPRGWTLCHRPAIRSDRFCRRHRDALDGAVLGLMQWEQRLQGAEKENEAYYFIPDKASVCKACATRRKWKIPGKRARRRLLNQVSRRGRKAIATKPVAEAAEAEPIPPAKQVIKTPLIAHVAIVGDVSRPQVSQLPAVAAARGN